MAAITDFARKFGLVLKACNLSRGALAQGVAIDKSVASRWASGVQAPTDQNLGRLTELVGQHMSGFVRATGNATCRTSLSASAWTATCRKPGLALPDRPSIAVLPFLNIGGDPRKNTSRTAWSRTSSPRSRDCVGFS